MAQSAGRLRMLNCYLGGTWFWLSLLLEPLQKHLHSIRVLQVAMMVLLLGLYLPDRFSHEAAMHLHRIRRRVVLVLLTLVPQQDWCCTWAQRKWNYLGHLLRQPGHSIARQSATSLCSTKAAVPSPWSHSVGWGLQQISKQGRPCSIG